MKKYKLVDKTPYQAAGFGMVAGASMGAGDAGSPAHMVISGMLGAGVGLIGGGIAAYKDAKRQRTAHFQDAAAQARHER